jgi:hypothetical protein
MSKKSNGFTKLPHGFHKRLREIKGVRLAVWLAHRCEEGKEGTSYPSLKALAGYTGYDDTTVKEARKWLRKHGWLVSRGQSHTSKGKFSVPIEHTVVPVVGKTDDGKSSSGLVGKADHGAVGFSDDGKADSEVDPVLEVVPQQVHPIEVGEGSRIESNEAPVRVNIIPPADKTKSKAEAEYEASSPETKEYVRKLGSDLAWELKDPDYDILDALRIANCFRDRLEYGDVALLLKIFTGPRWKRAEKTLAEMAFRLEAPPREDGLTLMQQFNKVRQGRERTKALAAAASGMGIEMVEGEDPGSGQKFEMEVEDI